MIRYRCNCLTRTGRCHNPVSERGRRCHLHKGVPRPDLCFLDFMEGESAKRLSERMGIPVSEVEDRIRKEMER